MPAAAVVEDLVAPVFVADRREAFRDLTNRGVPVDFLEAAVLTPTERLLEAALVVLVVVETRRLLAGVPLGSRMGLVSANLDQAPAVFASELDLEAAVAFAQDARGRFPFGGGGSRDIGRGGHGIPPEQGDRESLQNPVF